MRAAAWCAGWRSSPSWPPARRARIFDGGDAPAYAFNEAGGGAFAGDFFPASAIRLLAAPGALDFAKSMGFTGMPTWLSTMARDVLRVVDRCANGFALRRPGLPPALTGSRDAVDVSTHEVTYQGPSSFAVRAAALIADTEGIELTSAARADDADAVEEAVVLVLTVKGTDEAVAAGLAAVRAELPAGATVG